MLKYSLVLSLLFFSLFAFSQKKASQADKRLDGLETALEKLLKDWNAAGFAVAIVEKNKTIYSKGFGYRDVEKKLPVTPNTLFAIGSCTKAFTASLLGLLRKDGKVEFDKPVRTYLPELKFYNDVMDNLVTARDMMSHRTGLPRHDFSWYLFPTTRDSSIYNIRYFQPTASVREIWQYNNFMFAAQGVLAEKLYAKKWEQLIKEKFFDSLDMKKSTCYIDDLRKSEDAAKGYGLFKDSIIREMDYYDIGGMGPAGSINSSVNEMANWVKAWINKGEYNGRKILPDNYITEAISSQVSIPGALPTSENPDIHFATYGLGWFLQSYRGHYCVSHGGNIDGFSALTSFYPSDSIGVIVLANQNASPVPSLVQKIVADRMLKLPRKDWNALRLKDKAKNKENQKEEEKIKSKPNITYAPPTHKTKDYEGLYSYNGYGTIDIVSKNDSLFVLLKNKTYWLKHATYDVFYLYDVDRRYGIDTSDQSNFAVQFVINKIGEIESLETELQFGLPAFVFKKVPKPLPVAAETLKKYEGEYVLGGMTTKVYVKDNSVLYVVVPGQPEYETVPVGNEEFKLKILSGYSVKFLLNDKGDVEAMNFIQPNGTFKATKKK
ncbi:penicillin-binding protein [Terrimonas sp.]|uniref:serine hydrolase n=1 Tax=Terrimonas sp. TaxID=1914338 RepID=UPI000D50BB2F|nr:serine hydrolase [Terrimonas sp.]PVD53158.1 penicillin-binding protein [Terrimonas sp.]